MLVGRVGARGGLSPQARLHPAAVLENASQLRGAAASSHSAARGHASIVYAGIDRCVRAGSAVLKLFFLSLEYEWCVCFLGVGGDGEGGACLFVFTEVTHAQLRQLCCLFFACFLPFFCLVFFLFFVFPLFKLCSLFFLFFCFSFVFFCRMCFFFLW